MGTELFMIFKGISIFSPAAKFPADTCASDGISKRMVMLFGRATKIAFLFTDTDLISPATVFSPDSSAVFV
jgi:hypothetical protein